MLLRFLSGAFVLVQTQAPLLQDIQVAPPVLTPSGLTNGSSVGFPSGFGSQGCVVEQVLVDHAFAYSYGQPFLGTYNPPSCNFNRVTWNLTVTSRGRQFDRLGAIYFGDIELWRTSTAEPTQNGIYWTYIKDMSWALPLLQQPQKLIFDLGNLIDSTYTGTFNTTLTATFFTAEDSVMPADEILPISTRQGANNQSSQFSFPSQNASNSVALPRNIKKAVVSIAATGQIGEEFWYTNVPQSVVNTFGAGFLYGYSPFREVQLLIDGVLAGVAWPFPVIFTGGIVPGLWRPIVGIDAFDLREDTVDVTPFLPILCDGRNHTFQIVVSGLNDDGQGHGFLSETVGSYWLITGKIFLWLDRPGSITTGSTLIHSVPAPSIAVSASVGTDTTGANETLTYRVMSKRQLSISSYVRTASSSFSASWMQNLSYSNDGELTAYGNNGINVQSTTGTDAASIGYLRQISYPITVNSTYTTDPSGNYTITANLDRGQSIKIAGQPVFPTGLQSFDVLPSVQRGFLQFQGSNLYTTQNGSAVYQASPAAGIATSYGTTAQDMVFSGIEVSSTSPNFYFPQIRGSQELYHRYVKAVNSTLVEDDESLIGRPFTTFIGPPQGAIPPSRSHVAFGSQKRVMGRGRGSF